MSDPYHIPDGELCRICGLTFYSRSYGGPGICPSCDCGNFGIQAIENQRKEIQRLAASVDRLTSDKARLAVELAAEQESNTFLNNLHTVDQDRLRALEAENVRLNMEMVAYRQKLTPKDIEAMTAVIAALQAEKAARAVPETACEHDYQMTFDSTLFATALFCKKCGKQAPETPADYTIDGDGVWMGGKWHPKGAPKSETVSKLCPHGFVLADNTCGPCSEGRPNRMKGDDHG